MSKRGLAIGRVIDWAKTGDIEEVHYVLHRMAQIVQERTPMTQNKPEPKRVYRKRDKPEDVRPQEGMHASAFPTTSTSSIG